MTPFLPVDLERKEAGKLAGCLDSKAVPSPGVGHTEPDVHVGVNYSPAQVDAWLTSDNAQVSSGLDNAIPWWRGLSDVGQDVLAAMTFQMASMASSP